MGRATNEVGTSSADFNGWSSHKERLLDVLSARSTADARREHRVPVLRHLGCYQSPALPTSQLAGRGTHSSRKTRSESLTWPCWLTARRAIAAGEELTSDYATMTSLAGWRMPCTCGSEDCRGAITGEDWRLPELGRRYRGRFSPFLNERIAEVFGVD